jgi:sulfocyanin SoxE-like protein
MLQLLPRLRIPATAAVLMLLPSCAGHSQSAPKEPQSAPPASAPSATVRPTSPSRNSPAWLAVDSAERTATVTLEVTAPAGSPSALINGYRAGEARIVIPLGWTVKWNWHNGDPGSPHSLVVMVQREKIPLEGGRPAFSNAMTRMVGSGLPPGATDQTTFVADEAGWYWLLCGVPNHALNGEWLELRVDPEAKAARVEIKKA